VCFYINKRIKAETVQISSLGSGTCSIGITIQADGKKQQVVIHNIYHLVQDNNLRTSGRYQGIPKSSCLPQLETLLSRNSSHAQVVVGDFNLHHPKWSLEDIREYSRPATTNMLLEIMSRHDLDICTEQGTITRPAANLLATNAGSTIDLVWATEDVRNCILECNVMLGLDKFSDHLLVATFIEYAVEEAPKESRRLYYQTDPKIFYKTLKQELLVEESWETTADLDQAVDRITTALQAAVEASTPIAKICSRSVPN
jgi:exonuclease III